MVKCKGCFYFEVIGGSDVGMLFFSWVEAVDVDTLGLC